jgi:hypothetical protein
MAVGRLRDGRELLCYDEGDAERVLANPRLPRWP